MTRAECERKLIELVEQAVKIYHQYNPNGGRLHISAFEDGYISVSDIETVDDPANPGNVKIANWTLDGAKNSEGEVYSMDFDDMTINEEASA
jgi:hypothetical protein